MNNYEIKNDEIFIQFIEDKKNISWHREKSYRVALTRFVKIVKKPLDEYIEYIKLTQLSYQEEREIPDGKGGTKIVMANIEPDLNHGELYKDFKNFYNSMEREGLKNSTIDSHITDVRSFLKKQGIKLPGKIEIIVTTNPKKILKHEKIKRAIEKTPDIRNKAIIAFMAGSGLRSKDVRYFKIKDLLNSLNLNSIDELFRSYDNETGFIDFKPSKTKKRDFVCKTGITPYSIKLIIMYLRSRRKNGELKEDFYLFSPTKYNKKFSAGGFGGIFKKLNKELYYDDIEWFKDQLKIWQYDEQKGLPHDRGISPGKYEEEINDISKFHAQGLRIFFINTISSHCGNLKVATAMEGHKSPVDTDDNYTNFDRQIILNHYFPIIPFLSFEKTIVNELDHEATKKLKKELADTKEELKAVKSSIKDELLEELRREMIN